MATRLIPTGESRPSHMPCIVCGQMIDGPSSEYVTVQVYNDHDPAQRTVYQAQEPVRRHFLNDTHAVTLLTIDHKPVPFTKAF